MTTDIHEDANLLRASLAEMRLEVQADNTEFHRYLSNVIDNYDALMKRLGIEIVLHDPDDNSEAPF